MSSNISKNPKLAASQFLKEKKYWMSQLAGEFERGHFPYDFTSQGQNGYRLYEKGIKLSEESVGKLTKLSRGSDPNLHMILMSLLVILLDKYSHQNHRAIVVGTSIDRQEASGDLVNTILPLRVRLDGNITFKELLLQVRQTINEAIENQNYPIAALASELNIENDGEFPLFDVSILLENIQERQYVAHIKNNIIFSFLRKDGAMEGKVEYNSSRYREDTIERLISDFNRLLRATLFNVDINIDDVELLSGEDKKHVIAFNSTEAQYPEDKTIYELFEQQVEKKPEQVAVKGANFNDSISYRTLNERANRLARSLRETGVKPGSIVAIMAERSIEMIIAIMGVLKAGGAYLPIDTEYPGKRKNFILNDSRPSLLLTHQHMMDHLHWKGKTITIEGIGQGDEDARNLENMAKPSDLVYVIYTSGSTGTPKGVMIQHQGLVNYISWAAKHYVKNESINFPLYTSISFDLTVTSIFTPLVTGNTIILYPGESKKNLIEAVIADHQVGIVKLTPTHLKMIRDQRQNTNGCIKGFIVGGEELEYQLASDIDANFAGNIKIYNEYGPTEAVVGCMTYVFKPGNSHGRTVPIGIPAHNVQIYILDGNRKLLPAGFPGEMYISGVGVARGYLNQPELTAERFVSNPNVNSHRMMYKTGDLAKWLPDWNMEFLGRVDQQVKIRGYRIELGEIESLLARHDKVKEAVALAVETHGDNGFRGSQSLCAYYVPENGLKQTELVDYLKKQLPDYMIPSYFVELAQLPVNANGKIDRKLLPKPEENINTGTEYCAPRNETEKMLAKIFAEVLGVDKVGIDDGYFNLGGDSIKAIQLISRLHKMKLKLELNDLFQWPAIRDLSRYVTATNQQIDQSPVEGEVHLTPIQEWFCEKNLTDRHHFNQAVMLFRKKGFNEEILVKVFNRLVEHHDALRMVLKRDGASLRQINRGISGHLFDLEVVDLKEEEDYRNIIKEKANTLQKSIHLHEGPLLKLGLFKTAQGDYLLIAVHHLVFDGVSWRIIFEDFSSAYQQSEKGEEIEMPLKTTSYREWAEKLYHYANSQEFLKRELPYWRALEENEISWLVKPKTLSRNRVKHGKNMAFTLTKDMTNNLLKRVNAAYNTEINDILLTALGLAVKEWSGMENVLIELEGHGREEIVENIDLTGTVGWFTSIYPVVIPVEGTVDLGDYIKRTKDMLRNIPNKGIGYGILKYITGDENKKDIHFKLQPQIVFNYLGQFDQDIKKEFFRIADISPGYSISPDSERLYPLEIVGIVVEGMLRISVNFNDEAFDTQSIGNFNDLYKKNLQRIINHCTQRETTELTVSDFSSNDFDAAEVESIFGELEDNFANA